MFGLNADVGLLFKEHKTSALKRKTIRTTTEVSKAASHFIWLGCGTKAFIKLCILSQVLSLT